MTHLLDTNVLSELRRRSGDPRVKRWVAAQRSVDLYISVITVMEIELGVMQLRRRDPRQAETLNTWFEQSVLTGFSGRVVPLDLEAARRVPPLHVPDVAPERDAMIAGIAQARGFTVVTRNVRDFARTGVVVVNPWDDQPT